MAACFRGQHFGIKGFETMDRLWGLGCRLRLKEFRFQWFHDQRRVATPTQRKRTNRTSSVIVAVLKKSG